MTESELNNFDDPALKAMLKRAGANHRASDELRARAERILRGEVVGRIDQSSRARSQNVRRLFIGVAAMALVGLIVALVVRELNERHELAEQAQYVADNRPLIDAMAADHASFHSSSPSSDLDASALAQKLSDELAVKVRVADLADQGFRLQEASLVSLGNARAARITYVDADGKLISIYTLPFDAFQKVDAGDIYSLKTDHQIVAGRIDEDGVRCIVTERAFDPKRAFSILDRFRS